MKKDVTKAKSRDTILKMIDYMIEQYGDIISLPLIRVDQSDNKALYTSCLPTSFLQALICRLPRNLENPEGIQRALITKKVSEIANLLSYNQHSMPNAIVITLKCESSPFVSLSPLESSQERNSAISVLTVLLKKYRNHLAECETDEKDYLLEPEEELLGYLIDGHHRTEGAFESEQLDYAFPTSIYLDLDIRKMAEIFAGINCYQEKPSAIHTNAMRRLSQLMSQGENEAFSIMDELNRSGIFKERIKMFDGVRPKTLPRAYLSASKMQSLLEKWLEINVAEGFRYQTISEQIDALECYFEAWKACYPDAWGDSKYVLTKTMGIDILFDLYGPLCQFMRTEIISFDTRPNVQNFIEVIHKCFFNKRENNNKAVYEHKTIDFGDGTEEGILINWESSNFGSLSSGKGISVLKKILRREIGNSRSHH